LKYIAAPIAADKLKTLFDVPIGGKGCY